MSTSELAASYAALILADDGVDITVQFPDREFRILKMVANLLYQADKLQTLIKAAKIEDVEPIWTTLFAKVRTFTMANFRNWGMDSDHELGS